MRPRGASVVAARRRLRDERCRAVPPLCLCRAGGHTAQRRHGDGRVFDVREAHPAGDTCPVGRAGAATGSVVVGVMGGSMRSDIRGALIAGIVGASLLLSAAGCRAGETTEGGHQMSGPSPSPLAVTPRPPLVGGGTAEPTTTAPRSEVTPAPAPTPDMEPAVTVTQELRAATPVATAYTVPAVDPAESSLESQVRAAVERYFPPAEWATAMRVAKCESGYQPWAVEPGGEHFGIWQVDPQIWGTVPSDIDGQTRQAAMIVAENGWSPWQCR